MNQPMRYSSSEEGIEDLLSSARTGCLMSESRPQGPRVYTMLGQLVAAVAAGDGERWLERLVQRGSLGAGRASELRRSLKMGEQSMDLLASEVSSTGLSELREQLMKENLASFLALPGPAWFEPMTQHVVPDLQVHHDTALLLSQARQLQAPREPDPPIRPPISRDSVDQLNPFEDHDRERSGGQGEFIVQQEHLDVVDLGPSAAPKRSPEGIRFATPGLDPEQVVEKLRVCNEVLRAVQLALNASGVQALPKLQNIVQEDETDFAGNLAGLALDVRGQLSFESLQHALSLRSPLEHRRIVEHGLLDLMERALDLAADQLDEQSLDRVLQEVAGFSTRIRA